MKIRAGFLVGAGVGFLVGTPAGRRQVERIAERVNALLGEEGPWSGPIRERPGGRGGGPVATSALSSREAARAAAFNRKVVEAARAAARAAAAVVPRIIRPASPQPSEHLMGYGMPAQREHLDPDRSRDGNGQENGSES